MYRVRQKHLTDFELKLQSEARWKNFINTGKWIPVTTSWNVLREVRYIPWPSLLAIDTTQVTIMSFNTTVVILDTKSQHAVAVVQRSLKYTPEFVVLSH
jgi:hypothetical protein